MRTTRTLSTNALALLLLLAAGTSAHAQNTQGEAATGPTHESRASKLEWPRTFGGQPDFLFTRDEAMADARARAARENEPLPLTPSLKQLVEDDTPLDPLGILAPKAEDVAVVSGSDVTSETSINAPRGQTLMERLMAQAVDLPTVAATGKPDLTEFNNQLAAAITTTVAGWQPQPGRYSFDAVLNGLTLQAIVTSPVRYAVINQQRYAEGETFRISVPLMVPDTDIHAAMDRLMPVSGTLPAELQSGYDEAYKTAWNNFAFKRNQDPALGRQTMVLPVRITAISARQVMLDVNGQPYALQIRYAY
jgi:hypothetical protein